LLVRNDETLWPNFDVAEIGQAIIFLLKILNFMVDTAICHDLSRILVLEFM
jgi:hypothetical protein